MIWLKAMPMPSDLLVTWEVATLVVVLNTCGPLTCNNVNT
jgi:hypothetical protein